MCVGYTLLFGRLFPHGRASYCNRQRLYAKIGCKGTTFFSVSQAPIQFAFIFAPPCPFSRRTCTTSAQPTAKPTANGYIVNTPKAAELHENEQFGYLDMSLTAWEQATFLHSYYLRNICFFAEDTTLFSKDNLPLYS